MAVLGEPYDYTADSRNPFSSTLPHTRCNFHRQEEWGTLHLVPFANSIPQKTLDAAQQVR